MSTESTTSKTPATSGPDIEAPPAPFDDVILRAVQPSDLDDDRCNLMGTFGHFEREVSAAFVIRLMNRKGGWLPFSQAELDAMDATGQFLWNGLKRPGWIRTRPDGMYEVTAAFVVRAAGLAKEPPAVREEWRPAT